MQYYLGVVLFLGACASVLSGDALFGMKNGLDSKIVSHVEYAAIPGIKRVKYFSYNTTDHKLIKAIRCYDHLESKASVNITDGGVQFDHVTLRMKSQRGQGLNYNIEIYV